MSEMEAKEEIKLRELLQANQSRSKEVLTKAEQIASLESNENPEKPIPPSQVGIRGELIETKENLALAFEVLQVIYNQLRERKSCPPAVGR